MTPDQIHAQVLALGMPAQWVADSDRVRCLGARLTLAYLDGGIVGVWEPPSGVDVPDCMFSGSLMGVLCSIRSHIYRSQHVAPDVRADFLELTAVPLGSTRTRRGAA